MRMIKIKKKKRNFFNWVENRKPLFFILNVIRHFKRECRRGVADMMPSRFATSGFYTTSLFIIQI